MDSILRNIAFVNNKMRNIAKRKEKMEFIEKLINELNNRNITKAELARNADIPNSTIRSWEKGSQPTIDKVMRISEYLEISIDELCGINAKNRNEIQKAYEAADPGTQAAVRKLLDIKEKSEEEKSLELEIG